MVGGGSLGGVGPMTVALLLKNTVENAKRLTTPAQWRLAPLSLALESPVPADIVIASAQKPKPIDVVAAEVGLKHSEVDLYGKNKAKVGLEVLKRLAGEKGSGGAPPNPSGWCLLGREMVGTILITL